MCFVFLRSKTKIYLKYYLMINEKVLKTPKIRQSNIELLRVVAMFFVLIVHADFLTYGIPNQELLETSPFFAKSQLFWEAFGISCVNIFIMISGWFGIKFKLKGLFNLLFQVLFSYNVVYLFGLITGNIEPGIGTYLNATLRWNWFIPTYFLLYFFSPLLNYIVEKLPKPWFTALIILLIVVQSILSWGLNLFDIFNNGLNVVFFIVLYLLARYLRLYGGRLLELPKYVYIISALVCVGIITVHGYYEAQLGASIKTMKHVFSYCNPCAILIAANLLVLFSRLNFNVKFINVLAGSSLSVLIFHIPTCLFQYFKQIILTIGEYTNGLLYLVAVALFLSLVYIISVGIDQVRIGLWKRISACFAK